MYLAENPLHTLSYSLLQPFIMVRFPINLTGSVFDCQPLNRGFDICTVSCFCRDVCVMKVCLSLCTVLFLLGSFSAAHSISFYSHDRLNSDAITHLGPESLSILRVEEYVREP